jgi:hyperosmotically inducible protein
MQQTFKKQTTLLFALLTVGAALPALAFDTDQVQKTQSAYAEQFTQLDVSENGLLNWSEAQKDKSLTKKQFAKADKDADGSLDQDEFAEIKTALGQQKVSQVVGDSVITTKAKAKLLAEESLKSLKISVETYRGEVILSGFVTEESAKTKAQELVASIEGVKSVKNSLVVKQ